MGMNITVYRLDAGNKYHKGKRFQTPSGMLLLAGKVWLSANGRYLSILTQNLLVTGQLNNDQSRRPLGYTPMVRMCREVETRTLPVVEFTCQRSR